MDVFFRTGTAVMSPVVREEQREMARRNTVNEDREDDYEAAVVNGDAIVVDGDEEITAGDVDQLPSSAVAAAASTLVRSASVPLDPKAMERDEYDTRSVTSDILPEGQDEQPGCVIA